MAAAVCGCGVVRDEDDDWTILDVAPGCPFGHVVGMRGRIEGEPARLTGIGECVTIVFEHARERSASRTAMLATFAETSRAG